MNRVASRYVAVLVLCALLPVIGEVVENAIHLLQKGHFAHAAADGDDHAPATPEHGCSGVMHVCACCMSSSFLTEEPALHFPVTADAAFDPCVAFPVPACAGSDLFHPPRA